VIEQAFKVLVERHHRTMLAVARQYVSTQAWLGVVKGLDRSEGRSKPEHR